MISFSPVRPSTLQPGDLVQLVAPSGWVRPDRAAAAIQVLASWGLRAQTAKSALSRHFYLAGTDEERLDDFNNALRDPEVRAVLCLRGGYGAQRIIDDVDFDAVRSDPKLFMGFSDITALHIALWCETRLATVHGPTAAYLTEADSSTTGSVHRALMTCEPVVMTADDKESCQWPISSPQRRPVVVPAGGHGFSPLAAR